MSKINRTQHLSKKFSSAATANIGRIHIIPSGSNWAVKKEGAKRALSIQATPQAAVEIAKGLIMPPTITKSIIVHQKDGRVQSAISDVKVVKGPGVKRGKGL